MVSLIAQTTDTAALGAGASQASDAAVAAAELSPGLMQTLAPYMGVFFIAFFASIIATPLMRMLAVRNGIVDLPDLKRKNHIEPVAYLGGVAIFLAWLAAIASSYYVVIPQQASLLPHIRNPLVSIFLGAAAITLTGFFDDVYGISPRVKIGGQFFAAAALANYNVGTELIDHLFLLVGVEPMQGVSYILGTALIAVMVIGGCNAMNLLDGLDGLASGVTVIAGVGFLLIAAHVAMETGIDPAVAFKDPIRLVVCMALIGAVLGFLPYNFNPASIFMGDAGSLLLGYLCVASILLYADTGGLSLRLVTAGLIVFAVPITDTSLAIFRRKMQGKPILSPDSQHIHHLLRRSGLSVKQSVVTIYTAAIVFAVLGYTMVALDLRWRYVLAVFFVIYGFIVVTAYKYGRQYAILHPADGDQADEIVLPEAINGEDESDAADGSPTMP